MRETLAALKTEIAAEEQRTHVTDRSDPHYSVLSRSMRDRADNLNQTIAKFAAVSSGS
jgi:hypothetical protein